MLYGAVAASLLLGTATSYAHHAFAAEYDIGKPIALKGKLTGIEWVNPHGWIHMEVKDPKSGKLVAWAIEFGAPNALMRRGLRRSDFQVGATVEVQAYLAKNGKAMANGTSVKLEDGRDFFTGSSGSGAPPK